MEIWSEKLLKAMVDADRLGAATLIDQALKEGWTRESIIKDILAPALVQIGAMWGKASVSLAQGFVGAKIAEDTLLRCLPDNPDFPVLFKGTVVIGNIEEDFHSLGRRMVASFLRAAGWEVHDLGNDVLPEQFIAEAIRVKASVVGASAMMQTTGMNILKLRRMIDERGLTGRLQLAVGGAIFNWRPELVAEVGGDGTAQNAYDVDALFVRLQAVAKGTKGS